MLASLLLIWGKKYTIKKPQLKINNLDYFIVGLEALSLVTRASCSAFFGKVHISVMVDTITTQSVNNKQSASF